MLKYFDSRAVIFLVIFILFGICLIPLSISKKLTLDYNNIENSDEGQILFAPMYGTTTYLIDREGEINNSWSSSYTPGEAVYILDDGSILRAIKLVPSGGGSGGGVQKMTWDGEKVWEFTYYTNDYLSHHDIEPLPNGNVLMIAWEYFTRAEALAQGRDPNKLSGNKIQPDHIIEVEPTGPSSGEIVWEWHAWDHLIQDYDPSKENYGVVEDHPELIDINFGYYGADWMHTNSIDYNEEFDQIVVSVRYFSEIWIIDHSTTTEEAAGHTGGNSGKGGDLLYRWGNPRAYGAGTISDQKFFDQHDTSWILQGRPGEGNLLVYNNGVNRPSGDYSSVDEIVPPVDEFGNYSYEPGSPFGPEEQVWIYTAENPTSFYSFYVGGAERLKNGNTLICEGARGKFFEVTPEKEIVWQYVNNYPSHQFNDVFKIQYIEPEEEEPETPDLESEGSLYWEKIEAGSTVHGIFKIKNTGGKNSLLNWKIVSFPDWGNWSFTPDSGVNLTPNYGLVNVRVNITAPLEEKTNFEGYIRIENEENSEDFELIPVVLKTPTNRYYLKLLIEKLLFDFGQFFTLFENLFYLLF